MLDTDNKPYYKATEIEDAPYLAFDFVAASKEELKRLGLDKDKLIVKGDEIPGIEFGVSTKKIKDGKLVKRTITKAIKEDFAKKVRKLKAKSIKQRIARKVLEGFTYDGHVFSNTLESQVYWQNLVIQHLLGTAVDTEISTLEEEIYLLTKDNIVAFYNAYLSNINDSLAQGMSEQKA